MATKKEYLAICCAMLPVFIAGAGNVPGLYTEVYNEPLTGNADLVKSGRGTLCLTAPSNNTFTGNIVIGKDGGTLQLGGNLLYTAGVGRVGITLPAMGATNSIAVNSGGTLLLNDNNNNGAAGYVANRLGSNGDRPSVILKNGIFTLTGQNAAGTNEQSIGELAAGEGLSSITVTRSHASSTTILQADKLQRNSGAHLVVAGTSLGTAAANVSQIVFNTPPAMIGGGTGVIPGLRYGDNFVTYGDYGLRALMAGEYLGTANLNTAGPNDNVKANAGTFASLDSDVTVNSLMLMLANNWAMGNGKTLTIRSGQVLLTQNCTISQGIITAGAGEDIDLDMSPTANTLTISANITDNGNGKVRLIKSGASTLTISSTSDNTYSGGTVALYGTLQTSGTTANRRFFGSGPVLVNGGYILLTAIGSTANTNGPDYTVVNVGQISIADAAYTADDTFYIGAGSLIYGPSSAGKGLNSLERGVNITLEPDAVVLHAALAAPFNPDTQTIRNLGTDADLFFGINADQSSAAGSVTIGRGTPFKGISSNRGNRSWLLGTIDVATGTTDIALQGLAQERLGPTPLTLTMGNGATAGGPIINLGSNDTVNAHLYGYVTLDDDNALYGDATIGAKLNFVVESGAYVIANRANCLGSGAGVASITVKDGGTLTTVSTVANNPWNAFNGDVTVEAGGRLIANTTGGLTGAGLLTLKSGAILHINQVDGFSGSQAANAVVEPGVIVRVAANLGSANEHPNTHLHDKAVVWEIFGADRTAVYPSNINTEIMTLERSPDGRGGLLTNDDRNRAMTAINSGYIGIGPRGGAMAATRLTTLTVSQQFNLDNNELTIGDTASLDWVSEPKLGTVTLSGAAYASTSGAGGRISVLPGASLRNAANSLPTMATLNVDGDFSAAGANTIGALSGTGTVTVASALTVGQNNANTTYGGTLGGSASLSKVGSGRLLLDACSSNYTGAITIGGGELALANQGELNSSAVTLEAGGTLHLDNTAAFVSNRLANAGANVTFNGGALRLTGKANENVAARFAQPNFAYNSSTIEIVNGADAATELRFNSNIASATPNGALEIVASNGTLGAAGNNPRLYMAGLSTGLIGFASVGGAPAWYDSALGFRAFSVGEGTEFNGTAGQTTLDTVFTTNNVYPVLNNNRTVNSLWIDSPGNGKFINLSTNGNYSLTITSGRLNLSGSDDFEIRRSNGTGNLTWTTANLYLNIANPATTLTISAPLPTGKTVRKDGPGTLEINNQVSSSLSLNNGTVKYGASGDFVNSAVTIYGGQLDLTGKTDTFSATTIYNGGITNSDQVTTNTINVGTLTMGSGPAGSSAFISVGQNTTLQMGGSFTYNVVNNPKPPYINAKELVLGATRTFTVNDSLAPEADIDVAIAVPVSGSATHGIAKAGTGTMSLSGANTFDGNISVSTGLLIMNHPQAFGLPSASRTVTVAQNAMLLLDGSKGNIDVPTNFTSFNIRNAGTVLPRQMRGALISAGGTNTIAAGITLSDNTWITVQSGKLVLNGNFVNTTAYALTVFSEGDLDINGAIGNTTVNTLSKYSGGRLTIRGNSGHTGATYIYGGALNAQHNNALGTAAGGVVVYNTAALELEGNVTIGNEALTIVGLGPDNGGALRNIAGTNTYGGLVTLSTSDGRINSDAGLLRLAPASGNSVAGTSMNVIFGGNGDIEVANPIATGNGVLTKDGNGTLALKAANTYTGPTSVKSGRLTLDGTLAAGSAVTVNSGALLGGYGNAQGSVTLRNGATMAPGADGAANGNLVAGSLLLESGSLTIFEADPGVTNDIVTISGANGFTVQPGTKVALYNKGTVTPLTALGTYNLFRYSGTAGGLPENLEMHNPAPSVLYTFLVEGNWVKVRVESAKVAARAFSDLTPSSARFHGEVLDVAAEAPHVWFCLDYTDKGTAATGNWARVEYVGQFGKGETFDKAIGALESGSNYVYRVFAHNSAGNAWSPEAISLTTIYLPAIANRGARMIAPGRAELRAEVTDPGVEAPRVWFLYWISSDTVTNTIQAGIQAGACSVEASGLLLGTAYEFMAVASNQAGCVTSSVAPFTSATIYHVSNTGSDMESGLSWTNAMENIQTAINTATNGDMVLIAGGTYLVTTQIELSKSDFSIIGGYAGTIDNPHLRDPRQWPTLLKRDGTGTNRLMLVSGVANGLLEGLTLRGGTSSDAAAGAGLKIVNCSNLAVRAVIVEENTVVGASTTLMGAGAYVADSSVSFSNTVFCGNTADFLAFAQRGGGAAVYGGAVTFEECLFHNNHLRATGAQTTYGSGLYLEGGSHRVKHSVFSANGSLSTTLANARGDGLCVGGAGTAVTVFNTLFNGNLRDAAHLENGNLDINYATFVAHGRYGARRVSGTLSVANSILWQCADPTNGTMTVNNCLVDVDPLFERGLNLSSGSPAIDAGGDTATAAGLDQRSTAADGTPDNGAADLGYHFATGAFSYADDLVRFDPAMADLYVDKSGGDDGNSGSETEPLATIGRALELIPAGGAIRLAAGSYTNDTETFPLILEKPGIRLIGAGTNSTRINAGGSANNKRVIMGRGATGDSQIRDLTISGGYLPNAPSTTFPTTAENYWHPRYGAGLHLLNCVIAFENVALTNNVIVGRADDDCRGAGIYAFYSYGVISNSLVAKNTISGSQPNNGLGYGGGLYLNGGGWKVIDSTLTGNSAGLRNYGGNHGGAIAMYGYHIVSNCTIVANNLGALTGYRSSIVRYGSGIYMTGGLVTDCLIASNTIANADSTSTVNGGGIFMTGGTVRNSLVLYNESRQAAGGIYASGGLIDSVTATANYSVNLDAVAGVQLTGSAVVSNSIFYGNICRFDNTDISISASGGTVAYSCTAPYRAGDGNTGDDPEFTDPAKGDFTPMPGSPAIDSAITHDWMTNAHDMAGRARIRGGAPDMGAFESAPIDHGPLGINFTANTTAGKNSLLVTFTAFPYGNNISNVTYYWDLDDDGTLDETGNDKESVSFTYAPGYHSIRLTATNSLGEGAESYKSRYIWVSASEIYVWSGGSGYPGTSWANAFTNVQEAINFACGTNTIYLAGEIFNLSAGLVMSTLDNIKFLGSYAAGVEVVGPGSHDFVNHPTVLRRPGGGNFRILTVASMTDFILERIIVTGSNAPNQPTKATGGGINVVDSTITVTDCVVSNNQSNGGNNTINWGGGMYVGNSTATIRRTLFAGNVAKTSALNFNGGSQGGGLATENSNVHIIDSVFERNHSDSDGNYGSWGGGLYTSGSNVLVRNSLFIGNTASRNYSRSQGGAIYMNNGTIIENCTVVTNTIKNSGGYYPTTAGGIYAAGGYVTNTLVAFNTNISTNTVTDVYAANLSRFSHSRALELDDGANGNIDDDPLLVMSEGKFPLYSLDDGSPGINAGIRLPWMETAADLAGSKRVSGGGVDIGCYEKPAASATIILLR